MQEHRTTAVASRVVVLVIETQCWRAGPPVTDMATLDSMKNRLQL